MTDVLTYSNRLEILADELAAAIRERRRESPLKKVLVVVPHGDVETWLRQRLACRLGAAANVEFMRFRRFLRRLADAAEVTNAASGAPGKLQVVDQALLLEHLLGLFFRPSAPETFEREGLQELADYLRGGRGKRAADADADAGANSRRTQLAVHLARLFCTYDESTDYLVRWARGETVGFEEASAQAMETWQSALWRLLREELKLHDSLCVPLCELPNGSGFQLRLPQDTFLFGIDGLPLACLRLLQMLLTLDGGHSLTVFAFNPCREQWDDIRSLNALDAAAFEAMRRAWKESENFLSAGDDNLFLLEGVPGNPLLMAMGRPGRERVRVLNELTGYNFGERFESASAPVVDGQSQKGTALLARIQDDVLNNAVDLPVFALSPRNDESVQLLSCTGIQRECEAVAERAARLLRSEPGLKFGDISILVAADSADAYFARLVPSLAALGIPACLRELPPERNSRLPEAARRLLRLPLRGFTRTAVMDVLTHPSVMACVPGVERASLTALVDQLGIFQGIDRLGDDGRGEGYLVDAEDACRQPQDLYNWDQGLTRLALGLAMRSGTDGEEAPFVRVRPERGEAHAASNGRSQALAALGDFGFGNEPGIDRYWPVSPPMEMSEDASSWLLLARSLLADARFAAAGNLPADDDASSAACSSSGRSGWRTMEEWSRFIAQMLDTYLCAADDFERSQKDELLRAARNLRHVSIRNLNLSDGQDAGGALPVPYTVAHTLFSQQLDSMRARVGSYLLDGVNIARLTCVIPARHLFIVGVSSGAFPPVQKRDRLDLTSERLGGDWMDRRRSQGITRFRVTPRDRGRYLFLQAVLGARESLTISWQGRDQTNGMPLDASSAAADFQRLLQLYGVDLQAVTRTVSPRRSDLSSFGELRALAEGRGGRNSSASGRGGHSTDAMKEAAALTLREILRKAAPEVMDEALAAGTLLTRRGVNALIAKLPPEVRDEAHDLCSQLGLNSAEKSAEDITPVQEEPKEIQDHKVSVSLLSKFLENPAQASAQALLQLRQDDADATEDAILTRDDEVFSFDDDREKASFLSERMAELLCGSSEFFKDKWMQDYFGKLQKKKELGRREDKQLDAEIESMSGEFERRKNELLRDIFANKLGKNVSNGIFPGGRYGVPLMNLFSDIFKNWLIAFGEAGLNARNLVFRKIGFNTDEMVSAIVRQCGQNQNILGEAEIAGRDGPQRCRIRLTGVTGIVGMAEDAPGTLVSVQFKASSSVSEHPIRAFVHALAVLVSGQMPAHDGPYWLDCFTLGGNGKSLRTQFSGITIENARKYLLRLAEAMLSSPNNYWMPGAGVIGGLKLGQTKHQSMLERLEKSERQNNSYGVLRPDEVEALRLPNSDEMQAAFGDVNEPDADKTGRWGFFCAHRVIEKDKDKQKWDKILEDLQLDVGEN